MPWIGLPRDTTHGTAASPGGFCTGDEDGKLRMAAEFAGGSGFQRKEYDGEERCRASRIAESTVG